MEEELTFQGNLDRSAPSEIYLQVDPDGDPDDRSETFPEFPDCEVTWCAESQGGQEILYIRADAAANENYRLRGEISSLAAELDAARKDAERWQYFVSHMGAKAIRDAPRRIGTFGVFHINGVYTIHEISEGDDLVSTIDAALNADREK